MSVNFFCQEGPNKGKPGPCPGQTRGQAGVAPAAKQSTPKAKTSPKAKSASSIPHKQIADIYENAGKPEVTKAHIDDAVSKLKASKPNLTQLRAVAKSVGLTQKMTHGKTMEAIHRVMLERKGRSVRVDV